MGAAQQKDWFRYTNGTGGYYSVLIRKDYGAMASLGFAGFNAADPPAPKGFQMRYALCLNATDGRTRKVPVGATTATVWTGVTTTLTLPDLNDVDGDSWGVTALVDERKKTPHVIHSA